MVPSIFAQDICEGNFDFDQDVDANDVTVFLQHFGRSQYYNPCPPSGPAMVPKTGQTTSYATGDDGQYKRGVAWPNPRFTDNGNGTVTDNLTGLIWLKDANCVTFGTPENWYDALSDCNSLADGQCGLTDDSSAGDWRLPNLLELESLRDMKYYNPALSNTAGTGQWSQGDAFNNVQSSYYWSSNTLADGTDTVCYYRMGYGDVLFGNKGLTYYVWCVRGGQ